MSNKIVQYLQHHLSGEVLDAPSVRRHFATDGSIFEATPQIVVYPKTAQDVRKTLRFSWQLAEKGHSLPITARGKGTDQSGAAIGRGIVLAFPAHMNHLSELDAGKGIAHVQPGMNYRALQDVLNSHGLFLPPYPASIDYTTIGGAISNNATGEKTVKYGDTRRFVRGLQVVLSDGSLIQTRRLTKRELNQKKGQTDLEGDIYREVDGLLLDHAAFITETEAKMGVKANAAGYALGSVRQKDGSFDLTPLFVGAQGTLGVVTEAELDLEGYNPQTTLLVAQFASIEKAAEILSEVCKQEPSAFEMVDRNLLEFVSRANPAQIKRYMKDDKLPAIMFFIEFDDPSDRARKKKIKKVAKLLEKNASDWVQSDDLEEQDNMWAIRRSAWAVLTYDGAASRAVPAIEDGVVPPEKFAEYIQKTYTLFSQHHLPVAVWGSVGSGQFKVHPFLDLSRLGDRQRVFKLMEDYYSLIISLGGSISAAHGDGRARGIYLEQLYGKDMFDLFVKVKQIFDPHNILNPGVKVGATKAESMALVRKEYSTSHLSDYLIHN